MLLAEFRRLAPGKEGKYLFNDHDFGDIQAQIQFQTMKKDMYILSYVSWWSLVFKGHQNRNDTYFYFHETDLDFRGITMILIQR